MKVGFLTNIISPHQIPLAKELSKIVGYDNYNYVYTEDLHTERAKMGWCSNVEGVNTSKLDEKSRRWLLDADLVYLEERDFDLIEARLKEGKKTFYVSERWFKPFHGFSGWIRLFVPRYWKMVKKFVSFFNDPNFKYLPQGLWAEKDMRLACRLFSVEPREEQMIRWGYFVAPSIRPSKPKELGKSPASLKVLWVGRMIPLKHVETIVKAIRKLVNEGHIAISLTLVGNGPEEARLRKLSSGLPVSFLSFQPLYKVREIMREHDVYVFASNGFDGWGAVVNEAIEEGMSVLGTYETGAASILLPEENRFHVKDWKTLALKLSKPVKYVPIGDWSAKRAAERMLSL